MDSELDVLRTEKKYILPIALAGEIGGGLSQLLAVDDHCRDLQPYLVTSLYFDSITDQDYQDKLSGLEIRKKIRLRYYDSGNAVKLECKRKQGSKQRKQSLLLTPEEGDEIVRGNLRCLLSGKGDLGKQFYVTMMEGVYRPKSLIRYQRFAYVMPTNEIRITFDSRIEANEGAISTLAPPAAYYPVQSPDKVLMEVKYNHFLLQQIHTLLSQYPLIESAHSKYVRGRKFGIGDRIS